MKRAYWISTALFSLLMLGAGVQEVRHAPEILEGALRLGFPPYFITILGTAKLVGAPLLLFQRWPHLKEWAYAGFTFDVGGAIVCHRISGDTLEQTLPAILCASILAISYASYRSLGGPAKTLAAA